MLIKKCDRCKEEIKDHAKDYRLTLEEYDYSSGYYVDRPANTKTSHLCVNCYKEIWGQCF